MKHPQAPREDFLLTKRIYTIAFAEAKGDIRRWWGITTEDSSDARLQSCSSFAFFRRPMVLPGAEK